MKVDSKFATKIGTKEFIVTAEHGPGATANDAGTTAALRALGNRPVAVNIADNQHGVAMSSLAASVATLKAGAEPIFQIITRDRNRIALQSDLLGAAALGIRNVLCLSGHHQTLIGCPESANVYDLDSTQLIQLISRMSETGGFANGTRIEGPFSMLVGAVANPFLKPLELNLLRLGKKVEAGAQFIQTHAVFDIASFRQWLERAHAEGITQRTAILAGILPLESAEEAQKLRATFTDHYIPDTVMDRMQAAGANGAQKKAGLAICVEIIQQLKDLPGLRGIHILSGGKEAVVPEILSAAGL